MWGLLLALSPSGGWRYPARTEVEISRPSALERGHVGVDVGDRLLDGEHVAARDRGRRRRDVRCGAAEVIGFDRHALGNDLLDRRLARREFTGRDAGFEPALLLRRQLDLHAPQYTVAAAWGPAPSLF